MKLSTITLTPNMQHSLRRYIVAHGAWPNDPERALEECRSYASEIVIDLIAQLGGPVTHDQHIAHLTNSGPAPHEIEKANVLAMLEAQS